MNSATITAITTGTSNGLAMRLQTSIVSLLSISSCPFLSRSAELIGGCEPKRPLPKKQEQLGELKAIRKAADQQLNYAHNAIFKTLVKERLGEKEYMKLIEEANTELEAYEISGQMWDGYSRAHGKSVTSINKL